MKVERGNNRGGKGLNGDRGIEKCLKLCGGSIKTKEIRKKSHRETQYFTNKLICNLKIKEKS